jgi:pimeloyl-ACP methyl ester carboxylesterase
MDPIVLIHGYSAESKQTSPAAIQKIYGTLPQALRDAYGNEGVIEIDLSRYITLEDGLTIDDISRAFDRVLKAEFASLLLGKFHVIIHSTGALVIRNWLRLFSPKPSPIANLIYLAGANFGSGWGHIGKGQLAKWARLVFEGGAERGMQILDALELGAERTLDLHLHFLRSGNLMIADYGVHESVITGTQADVKSLCKGGRLRWSSARFRLQREFSLRPPGTHPGSAGNFMERNQHTDRPAPGPRRQTQGILRNEGTEPPRHNGTAESTDGNPVSLRAHR